METNFNLFSDEEKKEIEQAKKESNRISQANPTSSGPFIDDQLIQALENLRYCRKYDLDINRFDD